MYVELDLAKLGERLGKTLLRQRLHIQIHYASHIFGTGLTRFHMENAELLNRILKILLKCLGLYSIGNRNFRDIRVVENDVAIPRLPEDFDGYRILHLSDLHADLDPSLTPIINERIKDLSYDVCVITGDFRALTTGDYGEAIAETGKIVGRLSGPVYAVLGNHDFIEMVGPLEEMGIRFLLNENVQLFKGKSSLFLAGIDDPHTYETDNFEQACKGIPSDAVSLLLSHSPETYRKALACGFDFVMCGHTHGGQVCLPGGFVLLRNTLCPRHMIKGRWEYYKLHGYTSTGTGSSGAPVRFWCPPEIVVHTLRRA